MRYYTKIQTSINRLTFYLMLVIFASCNMIKGKREIKKYDGYWNLVEIEISNYDSLGFFNNSQSIDTVGMLKLGKDGKYRSKGISEIEDVGDWKLSYTGKRDVILFKNNNATVQRKSKNKLEIEFSKGNGTGKLTTITRYIFEFDENIDYKTEANTKYGISFKDGNGKDYFYENSGISASIETNYLQTKHVAVLDFINSKDPDGEYKFIRFKLLGDEDGFSNTEYTWNSAWSSNAINLIQYWDQGTSFAGIVNAVSSDNLIMTENDLVNQNSLKATLQSIEFSTEIPSLGTNKFTNIVIDMKF